jgi:hypothetical protein
MKSRSGVAAAIAFLTALPIVALYVAVTGASADPLFYAVCAAGFALLAVAVFDFTAARWLTWAACVAAGALAVTFLLQGASQLVQSEALTYLAYQVLGQWLERALVDVLILWFVAMLIADSRGKSRVLGGVVMALVAGLEVYSYGQMALGAPIAAVAPGLKLLYLPPFAWLLVESLKPRTPDRMAIGDAAPVAR